jgi:site-specific recombinase XerD
MWGTAAMTESSLMGPWVRRFLLEHLVDERNLSVNTQKSYRDMLMQLFPFIAEHSGKSVDRLTVTDISAKRIRQFLQHIEADRHCGARTRNQRLSAIHALAPMALT